MQLNPSQQQSYQNLLMMPKGSATNLIFGLNILSPTPRGGGGGISNMTATHHINEPSPYATHHYNNLNKNTVQSPLAFQIENFIKK